MNLIERINRIKNENHTLVSVSAENVLDKTQYPCIIKTVNKVGIEWRYLNTIKTTYEKPTANIILKHEKLKAVPGRSGTRQVYPSHFNST